MSFNLTKVLRENIVIRSATSASRRNNTFNYPHSFTGVNSAHANIPQIDVYPEIPRKFEVGDKAHYAHQNLRKFPDWYKPYGFNYMGDGWLLFLLCIFGAVGWSYMNDIKESKGRKQRKIYPLERDDLKKYSENTTYKWALDRLEKKDPNWTKFLVKKERAPPAHH